MKILKKKWWLGVIAAFVLIGAFVAYRVVSANSANATNAPVTASVEMGSISSTISGSGTVRSNQNTTISWQASGKVGVIKVVLGQAVATGDELAALDPNTLSQTIIQAQTSLIEAQNAMEELQKPQPLKIAKAETALKEAEEALDKLLNPSPAEIAQAELNVLTASDSVKTAQKYVSWLNYTRGTTQQIEAARAAYVLAQDKVDRLAVIYDRFSTNDDDDPNKAQALTNLLSAQSDRNDAKWLLDYYTGKADTAEAAEKQANLALAQSQYEDAVAALEKLKSPSAEDIALAQAQVEDARETLETLKKGATEDELTIAQTNITLAQASVNQAHLTAPFDGIITDINVMTGDIVSSGKSAFRIDDMSRLFVDLTVSEYDYSQIKVGQPCEITFDAVSTKVYAGVVTKVGLVGTASQGVVNFPVTVQITDPDASIVPGLTASVNIIVAQHENVMLVPNAAVQTTGSQSMVVVLFEGQRITIPVTVGLTNDTMTEVAADQLREGDAVITNLTVAKASNSSSSSRMQQGGFMGGPEMVPGIR
ncbi:MAG TPA: efflux RND transporter periplasmic adaptor subunit [Anaerolineaceae bacterium]|nr:efflux RND transporter periplasmic adaptor subunit [Anaerolineaceae bacterium]HPN54038.1 efflux RND transporter periplasmic adaptor subunit [Anaerolineaceae bacterium]